MENWQQNAANEILAWVESETPSKEVIAEIIDKHYTLWCVRHGTENSPQLMIDADKLPLLTDEEREWLIETNWVPAMKLAGRLAAARAELIKLRPVCLCKYAIKNWDGVTHDLRCEFAKSPAA